MNFISLLRALSDAPLDALSGFDRSAAIAAGLSPARVAEWQLVHSAYFGPTRSTRAARDQQDAATAAREAGISLDMLAVIERCISHLESDERRGEYRKRLLRASSGVSTCQALSRLAKSIVPARKRNPSKSVSVGASSNGLRTAVITACEHVMADLEAALRADLNADHPAGPQMAAAFEELMRSGAGIAQAAPRPLILVPAPQLSRIIAGDGDEITLGLSDGTTITGADFLTSYFANGEHGLEAALFHPTEGPVNLYRSRRFASAKQRTLAKATQPICASPDCRMPADHCEIHHVDPWKNGGPTNMNNLTVVCSYHNRVNDDDAHIHKRGRIAINSGRPTWVSPQGHQRVNKRHPYGAMTTLFDDATRSSQRSEPPIAS
nr:Uncharacterised protein [Streptococcus thermophilus]